MVMAVIPDKFLNVFKHAFDDGDGSWRPVVKICSDWKKALSCDIDLAQLAGETNFATFFSAIGDMYDGTLAAISPFPVHWGVSTESIDAILPTNFRTCGLNTELGTAGKLLITYVKRSREAWDNRRRRRRSTRYVGGALSGSCLR